MTGSPGQPRFQDRLEEPCSGVLRAWVRCRAALVGTAVLAALALAPVGAAGQVPAQGGIGGLIPNIGTGQRAGIGQVGPGQPLDTATARLLGLPTAPTRKFPEPDSVLSRLLSRPGYKITRYRADSATLFADEKRIFLEGRALTEQQGATLQADSITYRQESCVLDASGTPYLFDKQQVLVGGGIEYNTCSRRGIIKNAYTNFSAGSSVWFLRGNVAADSSAKRIYAASSDVTSCNLPVPHYHFATKQVKWVSKTVMVARPIVLYIRDVPILWLPFLFQDIRPGRRSGILVPQFGVADIIRTSSSYSRQISNVGYYWATNDYMDLTGRLDWFSGRYVQVGVSASYNVLDRFFGGSAEISRQLQSGGGGATSLRWNHRQQFNLNTSLAFDVNYVSNSFVVRQNALNPLQNTQLVSSSLNLQKRFRWGQVSLGGNRRQSLSDNSSETQLPSLTVSPKPLDIARNITWSPNVSLVNDLSSNTPQPVILVTRPGGLIDTVPQVGSSRNTTFNLDTPIRFGSFTWRNSLSVLDRQTTQRQASTFIGLNPGSVNPADSVSFFRVLPGDFSTAIDWQTGINLPILFQRSWKVIPSVNITNVTPNGPFALRNLSTGGAYVVQGKRLSFSLNSSPTLFAFLPGFGPITRFRHSVNPILSFTYSPAASIPEAFARAITQPGQPLVLQSDAAKTLNVSLLQTFEAKGRPQPGDTLGTTARKFRVLSINTSGFAYDFEQAKKPGRTGWITQTLSNSLLSDLLPGFNLNLTHDLWRGQVGSDTAKFSPFLSQLQTNFTLTGNTFRSLGSIFGLGGRRDSTSSGRRQQYQDANPYGGSSIYDAQGYRPTTFFSANQVALGRQPFAINVNYTLSRTRPIPGLTPGVSTQNLGFRTAFSPTRFWSLSWQAQYNLTDKRFESQAVQLQRDLHEWRAAFNFTRNANGNFAVFFSVFLIDLPELKFDYNQATFER